MYTASVDSTYQGLPASSARICFTAVILRLPDLARSYDLTAYLELAIRCKLSLATTDEAVRLAAKRAGVDLVKPA
jgi:hypothetical protein